MLQAAQAITSCTWWLLYRSHLCHILRPTCSTHCWRHSSAALKGQQERNMLWTWIKAAIVARWPRDHLPPARSRLTLLQRGNMGPCKHSALTAQTSGLIDEAVLWQALAASFLLKQSSALPSEHLHTSPTHCPGSQQIPPQNLPASRLQTHRRSPHSRVGRPAGRHQVRGSHTLRAGFACTSVAVFSLCTTFFVVSTPAFNCKGYQRSHGWVAPMKRLELS